MDSRRRIIFFLCPTLFFLLVGTLGYVVIEDYIPLEAIYMAVIATTTVDYGDSMLCLKRPLMGKKRKNNAPMCKRCIFLGESC